MKESTILQAHAASEALYAARREIERICRELVKAATPLDPQRYEILCQDFRKLYSKEDYTNPHEEFFRRAVTKDGRGCPKSFEECVRFVATFKETCRKIATALDGTETGRSDDGHRDLIDALAVSPQTLVEEICASPERFKKIEAENLKLKWLFEEEMFNSLHFSEALETYLPSAAEEALGGREPKAKEAPGRLKIKQGNKITKVTIQAAGLPKTTIEVPQKDFVATLAGIQPEAEGTITSNS